MLCRHTNVLHQLECSTAPLIQNTCMCIVILMISIGPRAGLPSVDLFPVCEYASCGLGTTLHQVSCEAAGQRAGEGEGRGEGRGGEGRGEGRERGREGEGRRRGEGGDGRGGEGEGRGREGGGEREEERGGEEATV